LRILIEGSKSASILARFSAAIFVGFFASQALAEDASARKFQPADIHLLKNVGDIAVSPDGEWVAYRVGVTDVDKDTNPADLFMVSWDGETRIQLTHTNKESESHPRFSPDGRYLAFIAERADGKSDEDDDPGNLSQVWLLNRAGGEAERITGLAGGVSGFEWSPDSSRMILVSRDPEKKAKDADEEKTHDTPRPIVIDRYQFKSDSEGYLERRYERLYVFDLEERKAILLTEGDYDSGEPAWSPDGDLIAFSSRREGDPDRHGNSDIYVVEPRDGATARQLTTHKGADYSPVFSPNGKKIAYLQGSASKYYDYDPAQLAVMSVQGGEPYLPAAELDRNVASPRWSTDGRSLLFLVTDDRTRTLRRVSVKGGKIRQIYPSTDSPGVVRSFEVGENGVVAVATFGQRPAELYRSDDGSALSEHNRELLQQIDWAAVEGFDSTSQDGEMIGAMLLKPPGFREGVAYPTIAYVHGGPVAQDGYEFDVTSQVLAAQGYLVVNPNYRGSSGRGKAFSRAIYADWGNLEIQDIHAIMDHLVEEGLADPERLGIGGWSYGGMNTNYAIATDTRFKAAVSGAAISNMLTGYGTDQYIQQYENEVGLPWKSIDTYLKISYPFFHADRIETPTLFMCGEKDFNVPLINSEQMYQALRSMNVPTKLIIYPGQHHGLAKPSYLQDRLERMLEWYGSYLNPNQEKPRVLPE